MPDNPTERHNIIISRPPTLPQKNDLDGKEINTCEKPPSNSYLLCRELLPPNSKVLVLCAGVGGEVVGAVAAGHNVDCVENNEKQWNALVSRLTFLQGKYKEERLSKMFLEQK